MSLKILHTSDWHLGKKLYRLDRLEEQSLFLDYLLEIISLKKIDHLIIAGDIFDHPQATHQSLKLWTEFLHKIQLQTEAELWVIAGNHDAATLLEIPQVLVKKERIHLIGHIKNNPKDHWFKISKSKDHCHLCLLPYFRPYDLVSWQEIFQCHSDDHSQITSLIIKHFLEDLPKDDLNKILVGHHLFGSFMEAGSEQAIFLSGLESIPLSWCQGFDYLALGHIHRPQTIKKESPLAVYSGSPIPMRFSEKEAKNLSYIEISDGKIFQENIPLPIFRELISIELDQVLWTKQLDAISTKKNTSLPPAIEIKIIRETIDVGLPEAIRKYVEEKGWILLSLVIENKNESLSGKKSLTDIKDLNLVDLFKTYYLSKFNNTKEVPSEILTNFKSLIAEVKNHENPES